MAAKAARLASEAGGAGVLAVQAQRAGMLAQRLARLHLARRWERRRGPDGELALAAAQLRQSIARLGEAPGNTPAIDTELQVAEGQLAFLLQAAREVEGRADSRSLEFVAKSADHILESMERAARLYQGRR